MNKSHFIKKLLHKTYIYYLTLKYFIKYTFLVSPIFFKLRCMGCKKNFQYPIFADEQFIQFINNCTLHIRLKVVVDNNGNVWCKRYKINYRAVSFYLIIAFLIIYTINRILKF